MAMTSRMEKFQEAGLIGCLNETGITSENYKEVLMSGEYDESALKSKCENSLPILLQGHV